MKNNEVLKNIGIRQKEAIEAVYNSVVTIKGIEAIFLKGSIARDQSDDCSDVDFYCLVNEDHYTDFLDKRIKILEEHRPIIYYSEANFVCPQIVAVFDNGLHFDLYITKDIKHGADNIKVLYDPKGLMSDYKQIKDESTIKTVIAKVNSFSFTLLEFEAAYRRKDLLWATRLGHHLIGDVSAILSYLYDKEKPYLGLKRLYKNLDASLLVRFTESIELVKPSTILSGVKELIILLEEQLALLPIKVREEVNLDFFDYMKNTIKSIKS